MGQRTPSKAGKTRGVFSLKLIPWLLLAIVIITGAASYAWIASGLPSLDVLPSQLNWPSVRITDREGRLLYEALPQNGGRHTVVALDKIPLRLRQATIATEDNAFYTNPGIDLRGILRSLWINLRGGETLAGGSTITQQVARSLLLDASERTDRSLRRKLRESLLAWELTRRFSKDEILALYLNQTYYGGMSYGVEAAAQTFFGKPVSNLDLAECALLAGLPQAPAAYNPFTDLSAAQKRQGVVLELMEKQGMISAEERRLAAAEPLVFASTPYPIEAPHFVMWVRSQLDSLFTPEEIYAHGGLTVRTTLNLDWQHHAERAITMQLAALRQSTAGGISHNMNDAALVALDPNTGEILAMVGSPDYFDAEHAGAVNMALAPRQPGSALKPLIYATALDPTRSQPFTAATMLLDVSTNFVTHDGQAYTPVNYDSTEHGPVLVRQALASSLNIPAVLTLHTTGLPALFNTATALGITTLGSPDQYDLSLALGGGEVSLLQLTGAYGAFANGGFRVAPNAILEVSDPQGKLLYQSQAMPRVRVLDERVSWLISDILSDDDARVIGFGRNSVLRIDRPAAVKTGTTTDFHDNWTIGYTPGLVVGVWAGNASHDAMRNITGLTGAAPVWAQFIRTVLEGQPEQTFTQPPGLVKVEVCAISGLLPSPACPYHRTEWFLQGTQPRTVDTIYRQVTIDSASGYLVDDLTPPERRITRLVLDLPPQAQAWAHSQHLALLSDVTPAQAQPAGNATLPTPGTALSMVSPADSAIFQIAPGLDADTQRLRLAAVGEVGLGAVTLYVDGAPVATLAAPPYETWWQLSPGSHTAWAQAVRSDGTQVTSAQIHFVVK